jgi:hypothetical protein
VGGRGWELGGCGVGRKLENNLVSALFPKFVFCRASATRSSSLWGSSGLRSDGEQAVQEKKATERRNVVDISGERWLFLRR